MLGKIILAMVVLSFLSFTGCLPPTRLEADYGTSHRLQKFNQVYNQEAEKNLEPLEGFDGYAAEGTKERYDKSFAQETKPPEYTLNIGGVAMGSPGKK
jgi:hypothetical protein